MPLKSELKKVIKANTQYTAVKIWKPELSENMVGDITMTIEISVRKKNRNNSSKSKIVNPKS